jgi:3-methyladenine DNA glycosylase AlkD
MASPNMTLTDVLDHFRSVRSDQIATIYSRRNPNAEILGVRFGDIDKLAKKIKKDTPLAVELWDSGSVEARELACRIIEPSELSEEQIDRWVQEIDYPTVADSFAGVVYKTPYARQKMEAWTQSSDEFVRRGGFTLVYQFAADPKSEIGDDVLATYLDQIGREIHTSPNWARETMNLVPIAIGKRNDALYPQALAVATDYGAVSVFHGDKTNCKIWNAVEALQDPKVHARRP